MPKTAQKDNQTFAHKKALRKRALELLAERGIDTPIVMETHGGAGKLWEACYEHLPFGITLEKNPDKTARLGKQRPTWCVYECDCEVALREGVGSLWAVDLLDVDPYGQAFPTLEAFFSSNRPFADMMVVVVNDGLRQKLRMKGAWDVKILHSKVEKYGNDLFPVYLDLCRELLEESVARAGYRMEHFAGYHCGPLDQMTHFLALLVRGAPVA